MSLVVEKPKRKTRRHYSGAGAVERGDSWRIWWHVDGKRQFGTLSKNDFTTWEKAFDEALRRKFESQINEATVTFEEWSKKYIDSRKDINQEPLIRFSEHFISFLKEKGYEERLRKITEDAIKEFLFDYQSNGHNAVGTNKALEYLRQIFEVAVEKNILSKNPTKGIKKLKAEKKITILPSKKEWQMVLSWFLKNERRLFPWFYFEATKGWRRDELRKMKVSAVDLERKRIRVMHYKQKVEREYPLEDEEVNILNEHFILLKKLGLYKIDGLLFPTRTGGMIQKDVVRLKIKKAAKELGIAKNLTNHIFRHYVVTSLKDFGMTSENIKEITGHQDAETIDRVYTHATSEIVKRGMDPLRPNLGKEFEKA